jgi:diketogulonate reductase-like aldo/keto reductase
MMLLCKTIHRAGLASATKNISRFFIARNMTSSSTSSRVTLSEFIYGTAWKKDETRRLVKEALVAGFRKVDTAAQPKHYQEDLVGDGLREAYAEGIVRREDLIVRVKYTTILFRTNSARCKRNSLSLADKI